MKSVHGLPDYAHDHTYTRTIVWCIFSNIHINSDVHVAKATVRLYKWDKTSYRENNINNNLNKIRSIVYHVGVIRYVHATTSSMIIYE